MLRLIGAGFGRTGTLSLKAALETLGYGPCYHMTEVFRHPEHIAFWRAAQTGEARDWERVFAGYAATADWPGCGFYEQLLVAYPDAKVLLSVRDPERWYDSVRETIHMTSRATRQPGVGGPPPEFGEMIEALIWQGTFQGYFEDRAAAIAVFERHIREVRERVPADRLLVFDVREGWAPLCRFLDVPVPEGQPFPHLNERVAFQEMVRDQRTAPERLGQGDERGK